MRVAIKIWYYVLSIKCSVIYKFKRTCLYIICCREKFVSVLYNLYAIIEQVYIVRIYIYRVR